MWSGGLGVAVLCGGELGIVSLYRRLEVSDEESSGIMRTFMVMACKGGSECVGRGGHKLESGIVKGEVKGEDDQSFTLTGEDFY